MRLPPFHNPSSNPDSPILARTAPGAKRAATAGAILAIAFTAAISDAATLRNQEFKLVVQPREGAVEISLLHLPSKTPLASGPYLYPSDVIGSPNVQATSDRIRISGSLRGGLDFVQELRLPPAQRWLEEEITLTNSNPYTLPLPHGRAGFVLPVTMKGAQPVGPLANHRFSAIPFVREPMGGNGQRAEYSLNDILTSPRASKLYAKERYVKYGSIWLMSAHAEGNMETIYPQYASEGWSLETGQAGFVISKYSQDGMEWSILDRVPLAPGELGLCWGGYGIRGSDPEHGAWLAPGATHRFGITRLTAFEGGQTEAFYTFRAERESRGMGLPPRFNPPVHWNVLYDNKLWWLGLAKQDLPENRAKYYGVDDLKLEAEKARALGCEALYLDPGWDTNFGSKIWDEGRLGPMSVFSAWLKRDYGLSLSLHSPMSGWTNPSSFSPEMLRLDAEGKRVEGSLCGASRQYEDESVRRFLELARGGATFIMLDGTMYTNECYDLAHAHGSRAGREEHVAALNRIVRRVHADYPHLMFEMHDQVTGGSRLRHVPLYYGYGNGGYDSVWGFELMWNPMQDLVGGHSIALYYYNLAYSIPLYLHIDLRTDTKQGLMFWWNASTVRHLGIGGTATDPEVRAMHQQSMATYLRLKPFFAAGTFYGIDELTHVHRHPTQSAAVVNCFNLTDQPVVRRIRFNPVRFGLEARLDYRVAGAAATTAGDEFEMDVSIPAYGHSLIEIN
ncbi:MAG: hypothetical protein U1F61_06570 [Opitutaceae bacterium]